MRNGHPDTDHERSTLLDIPPSLSYEEEEEDHARQVSSWKRLPWWKRPSPHWLVVGVPLASIGYSALLAPKVALYTTLACRVHRPEYVANNHLISFPSTNNLVATTDVPISHVLDDTQVAVDATSVHLSNPIYATLLDITQNGPDSQQKCASDPLVQATVARLNAVFTTSMGILTCLTTSWWSSLSDRHGRRIVIFASTCGLFLSDLIHVITAWFVDILPGGYWFPLLGFLIEGLCGGTLTGAAMISGYIADTTDPSRRSRYFSLILGLSFTGVAVGPVLGGLLIRSTGIVLSAFYLAFILHTIYIVLVLCFLPESLTFARARGARLRFSQEKANQIPSGRVLGILKSCTSFFNPLAVLLPEPPSDADANRLKRKTRDWSLILIAIAYALLSSNIGSTSYRFQYAAAQFHWSPEMTSYFVSCMGGSRALFLAVILPLVIRYLKPIPVESPTEGEPLEDAGGLSSSLPGSAQTDPAAPPSHSSVFDLALARASVALDVVVSLFTVLASTGTLFTLATMIGSFGAGFIPAFQALVLDIHANRRSENRGEVGKLYGALSVTQALASQIVSPAVYGFVYSKTVAVFPQAILVVSLCSVLLALVFLSFVRIPSEPADGRIISREEDEEN